MFKKGIKSKLCIIIIYRYSARPDFEADAVALLVGVVRSRGARNVGICARNVVYLQGV